MKEEYREDCRGEEIELRILATKYASEWSVPQVTSSDHVTTFNHTSSTFHISQGFSRAAQLVVTKTVHEKNL